MGEKVVWVAGEVVCESSYMAAYPGSWIDGRQNLAASGRFRSPCCYFRPIRRLGGRRGLRGSCV